MLAGIGCLAVLFIFGTFISYITEKEILKTLPLAVIGTVLILYLSGLAEQLFAGFCLILAACLGAAIFLLLHLGEMKEKRTLWFNWGAAVFLFCTVIIFLVHTGRQVGFSEDDHEHWARAVKDMFMLGKFGTGGIGNLQYPDYSPGVSLFLYFWNRFSLVFDEANLFRAQNFLYLIFLAPVFMNGKGKEAVRYASAALLCLLTPAMYFSRIYESLQVDILLGIVLAYLVVCYYNKKGTFDCINLAGAFFFLGLIKSTGLGLAVLLLVLFLAGNFVLKESKRVVSWNFVFLLAGIAGTCSWKWYCAAHALSSDVLNPSITAADILHVFDVDYKVEATRLFLENLVTAGSASYVSYGQLAEISFLAAFLLHAGMGIAAIRWNDNDAGRKRMKYLYASSIVITVFYVIFLWATYMFVYNEGQALKVASMRRYLSTVLVFTFCVSAGFLLRTAKATKTAAVNGMLIAFLLIFVDWTSVKNLTVDRAEINEKYKEKRETFSLFMRQLPKQPENDDKIFLVNQDEMNGSSNRVMEYYAAPVYCKAAYVGKEVDPNYADGIDCNLEEWTKILQEYDYVYLYKTDAGFLEQFGSLFEGALEEGAWYGVDKDNGLKLRRMEEVVL